MATHFICVTCGTQFAATDTEPPACPICEDERQYVGPNGQQWTTLKAIQASHRNRFTTVEPHLHLIQTEPKVGIGQRAFIVQTPEGNLLWDCITLLDQATIDYVGSLGGLQGIAISHPHYYSSMIEWSRAFGHVPIHVHHDDAAWVMRPDANIRHWQGEQHPLWAGLTLVRLGGHFAGFQALHWADGANQRGVFMVGDQPFVCHDPRWVSFMYSYPNLIPLAPARIRHIVSTMQTFPYDRLYGAFTGQLVPQDAKAIVTRSAERYLHHLV